MGKADQKRAQASSQEQIQQIGKKSEKQEGMLEERLGESRAQKQALFPQVTQGYSDIQQTGGYDPAVLGNIRDVYGSYTKTGGVSEEEATAMRNRAAAAAQGVYDTGKQEAQRIGSATGGYGDTSAAIMGTLSRKGAQAAERATTATNADIAGLRQKGRLEGAAGLGETEQAMAQNRLAATQGMGNIYGLSVQEANATTDQILQNYQTTGQLTQQQMQMLQQLANQPGVFDKIIGTIGTLGGAAAGIMSGAGAMKFGPSK